MEDVTFHKYFFEITGINDYEDNLIHQILSESPEGEWLMKCWEKEQNPEKRQEILAKENGLSLSVSKVARIVVFHELRRTNSYV